MRNQAFQPRRSDLAAAVSSTEQFRAHGAESHVALRCHDQNHAGRLTTDSVVRAPRHGDHHSSGDGSHVASTQQGPESYLGPQKSSAESAGAQLGACIGIACVLACALTDLPMRLVLAIVEVLR